MTRLDKRSPKQKEIDEAVLERVRNGIRLLEREYGEGWVDHIDLADLNLANGSRCVLGQLYANKEGDDEYFDDGYTWALENLDGLQDETQDGSRYGFTLINEDCNICIDRTRWEELTEAWRQQIETIRKLRV